MPPLGISLLNIHSIVSGVKPSPDRPKLDGKVIFRLTVDKILIRVLQMPPVRCGQGSDGLDTIFRDLYNDSNAPIGHKAIEWLEGIMPSYVSDKGKILIRLRKMEGQLKGIRKMIEQDKYCVDVLNQLSSIIAATEKVAAIIMKDHIQGCVKDALTRNDHSDEYINELVEVVERFAKR